MTGWKRWFYYNMGWEYDPTETTEKIRRDRHFVMAQIRLYGKDIKNKVLREEGEIPKIKATRTPTTARAVVEADYVRPSTPTIDVGVLDINNDFLDGTECDAPKTIQEYTALFEGFDIPPKRKRKRKRNPHKINF